MVERTQEFRDLADILSVQLPGGKKVCSSLNKYILATIYAYLISFKIIMRYSQRIGSL
jgi:hypothetical protein